jgi:Ca-activated chloride channel homolog
MQFGAPHFFWLLLLAPALAAFFWWSWRVRQRLMTRFIQSRLLAGLLVEVSPARQKLRRLLLLLSVVLLVVVLARPKWGFHLEEVKQRGLDIVMAIDTSRSMLANDVAPNRLARAKLEAIALQQLCRADRLGLVAFAGSAFLQCPLSLDDDAFRQSLEALDVNIIPQGGTALAEAIRTALTAFKEKSDNHKVLVLFTDGEDHDGQAVEAAQEAAKQQMRIFTIGVGTPNGELLAAVDEQGRRTFVKDTDGNVVKSRLNESLLQQIAAAANGFYLPLSGAKTMDTLYQRGLAPLPRTDSEVKTLRQYHERFQLFLALALVLLLLEMMLPDVKMRARSKGLGAKPAAAAALLGLLLVPLPPAQAASAGRALREYQKGHYDRAFDEYEKLSTRQPADARLRFNAGAAAYQDKEYDQALKQFSASLATPDLKLQERAYYNLGNTLYRQGEDAGQPEKQMSHWQQAVSNYESALKLDGNDQDARHNLELVKKKLEELKQQQQQQQKNQDQQKDKQDQQKNQDQQKDKNQQDQQQQQQQEQNKEDQQKQQDQQQKQQGDQQKKDDQQQKQDQDKQQQDAQSQEGQKKDGDQEQDAAHAVKMMQMTPQQARQLLDAERAEEKPMPFWQVLKTNRLQRIFKDW